MKRVIALVLVLITMIVMAAPAAFAADKAADTGFSIVTTSPKDGQKGVPDSVVFRNKDNSLTAVRATYSNITQYLVFIADRLGEFMVVGFDFDGKEFSPEFYEALAKLPELENLIFSEISPV